MPQTQKLPALQPCTCGESLPLRIPRRDDLVFRWECVCCGAEFQAAIDTAHPRDVRKRVMLAGITLSKESLPVASTRFQMFARFQAAIPSNRAEGRTPAILPANYIALDELGHPEGELLPVMTRDISTSGVGLMHDGPMFAPEILLLLPLNTRNLPVQAIATNVWQAEGENSWESGWQFLRQVAREV